MLKIFKYVLYDLMRSKMIISYTIVLALLSLAVFWIGADSSKSIISLLQLVLFVIPLISIVFATVHFYNSREFMELLLTQPLSRQKVFISEYLGISVSLSVAFIMACGVPMMINGVLSESILILVAGTSLTFIFTCLAYLVAIVTNDKAKAMGASLLLWFYFALLYDGLILYILFSFSDYPLEKTVIALTAFNPVDLARVLIILKLDASALMGYTGALYHKFFGGSTGVVYSALLLTSWFIIPFLFARKKFFSKDF